MATVENLQPDANDFLPAGDHCQKVEKLVLDLKQKYEKIFNSISEIQNTLIEEKLTDKSKNVFYILPASQINVLDRTKAQLFVKPSSNDSNFADAAGQDMSLSDQSAGDHILTLMNSSTKMTDDNDDLIHSSIGDQFNKVLKIDKTTKNKRTIVQLGDSHHQWVKKLIEKPTKCMACMMDLPLRRHCAECFICKTTVHHLCAENLYNTCGTTVLSSDQYEKEDSIMLRKFRAIHICGWVKVWHPTDYTWLTLWASLENEILSFFDSNNDDDQTSGAVFSINVRNCRLNIRINSNADLFLTADDRQPLPMQKSEWNTCFRIDVPSHHDDNAREIYVVAPDLPSKQRWLGALRKFSV
uniref:Phorbol-ester/DAG-type domain-containing protein n=1 Tax=Romanomermis culicivorax TaxID=13658 RepID=A0A915HEA0_ROMCU